MLKSNKGISLITAVMTVLLIIIILTTISYTAINNVKMKKINGFYSDLRMITDKVQVYYAEHGKLPVKNVSYIVMDSYIEKAVNGTYEEYANLESIQLDFILKDGETTYSLDNLYNPNDYDTSGDAPESVYYEVDLEKLSNLTLNNPNKRYLVNEQSKTIYCYEGIEINGEEFNKLPIKYKNVKTNE